MYMCNGIYGDNLLKLWNHDLGKVDHDLTVPTGMVRNVFGGVIPT